MHQYTKLLVVALISLLVFACDLLVIDRYPIGPHKPDAPRYAWTRDADAVVVLIGLKSDQQVEMMINNSMADYAYHPVFYPGHGKLHPVAFRFKTGDKAKLRSILLGSTSDGMRVTNEQLTFDDSAVLALTKPGIYYYGVVRIKNKQSHFNSEFDPRIIEKAKKIYPEVFNHMAAVNY